MPMKFPPIKISELERSQLTAMTNHQGFAVLQKMMEQVVKQSTVQMLTIEPTDPARAQKISDLQAVAYAQNSFCSELLRNIAWQQQQEIAELEAEDEPEQTPAELRLADAMIQAGYIKQ
jgi:hypothetical protein